MTHQDTIERVVKANPVPDADLLHPDPTQAANLFGSIMAKRASMPRDRTRDPVSSEPRHGPWYRRPQVVFAGAALFVAAIIAPFAWFSRSDGNPETSTPIVEPGGQATGLTASELLKVEDLPAEFAWMQRSLSDDWIETSDGHAGIRLALCADVINFAFESPVGGLRDGVRAGFHAPAGNVGTVTVDHMVYADSAAAVKSAYDDVRQRVTACVDDPTQWQQPQVEGGRIHGSPLPISAVGDERFAISYTTMTESLRDYRRLAVIRHGDRLTIVAASEGFIPRTAPSQFGRAEFEGILWQAVEYRGADEDCTGFCPSNVLLASGDLPDTFNWRLEPGSEWYNEPGVPTRIQMGLCPELWDFAVVPPLSDLQGQVITSLGADIPPDRGGGDLHLEQIAYTGSASAVSAAFDSVREQLTGCVDNPDRWDLVTPEGRAAYGWIERGGYVTMAPSGDDHIAVQFAVYNPNDRGVFFEDRLAMVRHGNWLTIVQLSEGMTESQVLSDDEFAGILQTAVARLAAQNPAGE